MPTRTTAAAPGRSDEAFQQIMFADRIVLSKIDLVSSAGAVEAWERIRAINAKADIVPSVRGRVDAGALVDVGGFDLARLADEETELEAEAFATHRASSSTSMATTSMATTSMMSITSMTTRCATTTTSAVHTSRGAARTELSGGHAEESADHWDGSPAAVGMSMTTRRRRTITTSTWAPSRNVRDGAASSRSRSRAGCAVSPPRSARTLGRLPLQGRARGLRLARAARSSTMSDVMEKEVTGGSASPFTRRGVKLVFIGQKLNREWLTTSFEDVPPSHRAVLRAYLVDGLRGMFGRSSEAVECRLCHA